MVQAFKREIWSSEGSRLTLVAPQIDFAGLPPDPRYLYAQRAEIRSIFFSQITLKILTNGL